MLLPLDTLRTDAQAFGIALTQEQLLTMDTYAALLTEWNEKINLTAITQPEEMATKHFLDSLLLLDAAAPAQGASLVDVGTGAGFPSVPCAVVRPDLSITLLDSLRKRLTFLTELCAALGVQAATVHARAEEAGRGPLRESFDIATARAVANLRELAEYCLPLVKPGGLFAALKGGDVEEELQGAQAAIRQLGGRVEAVKKYTLPQDNRRSIILVRKISQTPPKYPRPGTKIAKSPLT